MMEKDRRFIGVSDRETLGRLLRSLKIAIIRRDEEKYEALNIESGNRYNVRIQANIIRCCCPDSQTGQTCKHEMAVGRDLPFFEEYERI